MADTENVTDAPITVVPASEASWDDVQAIFGSRGYPSTCQCQFFKIRDSEWNTVPLDERRERLWEQTGCEPVSGSALSQASGPLSGTTSGLVAYLDGEPVGWCAVEPRTAYLRLTRMRVPWTDRDEDKTDDEVWSVTCFVTRTGFRRRGVSRALARATVGFARDRGARAVEGYPMITEPGKEYTWGELFVGSRSIFADAGFVEVSRPTLRRVVMRVEFRRPVSDVN